MERERAHAPGKLKLPQFETPSPALVRMYQSWSGVQRLKAGEEINQEIRRRLREEIATRHPDWSDDELNREVARLHLADEIPDELIRRVEEDKRREWLREFEAREPSGE